MAVDYDIVVIGSSQEGIYAAKNAAQLEARVALVTQSDRFYLPNDSLFNSSLSAVIRHRVACSRNFVTSPAENLSSSFDLSKVSSWRENIETEVQGLNSLSVLAALGVDIIVGRGSFGNFPQLGFQIKSRILKSSKFLLCTGTNFAPDFADNTTLQRCLTLRDLTESSLADLPNSAIVIGKDPSALALAQNLAAVGKQITLVVRDSSILSREDPDISILIQAQLEAIGVRVYTNFSIDRLEIADKRKTVIGNGTVLTAEEIIIADCRQPNISELNLTTVGVKYNRHRILVNRKLATTNPHIYACGDMIGGYQSPKIAEYEAKTILKNVLFFPWYKVDYHTVPWTVLTQPALARVGLNEAQARQKQEKLYVIRQYFNNVPKARVSDSALGICKLAIAPTGEILGCSIFGDSAAELIAIPALMMRHKIRLDRNPLRGLISVAVPNVYPSMAEVFEQAIEDFYQQKIQHDSKLWHRLQTWFSLRKN